VQAAKDSAILHANSIAIHRFILLLLSLLF